MRKAVLQIVAYDSVEVEIDDEFPSNIEDWDDEQWGYVYDEALSKSRRYRADWNIDEGADVEVIEE